MNNSKTLIEQAIWIAHTLFARNKVTGSTGNLSFLYDDNIFITSSGSCFGTLCEEDFSIVDKNGRLISGRKPSKELPLHQILYAKSNDIKAVLHTHSFYSVLWSMEEVPCAFDCVPEYTPYLKMKLGTVGLVDYEKPGSEELFAALRRVVNQSDGFILKQHGPLIAAKSIMDTFYCLEELEESCKLACFKRK